MIPRVSGVANVSVRQVDTGMDGVTAVLHPVKRKGRAERRAAGTSIHDPESGICIAGTVLLPHRRGAQGDSGDLCAPPVRSGICECTDFIFPVSKLMAEPFEPFAQKRNGITRIDDLQRENGNDWLERSGIKEPEMPENIPLHGEMDDEMLPVTLYDAGVPDASAVLRADAALAGIGARRRCGCGCVDAPRRVLCGL